METRRCIACGQFLPAEGEAPSPNEIELVQAFRRLPPLGKENLLKTLALILDEKHRQ